MGLNGDSFTLDSRSFSMTPWRLLVLSLTAALFTTPLLASAQSSASAGSGAAAGEQDCWWRTGLTCQWYSPSTAR